MNNVDYEQLISARNTFVAEQNRNHIHFIRVRSDQEYKAVMELRKHVYSKNVPYMLNQLHPCGSDKFDQYSYIYAAYFENTIIASTRLTPHPFETVNFIDEQKLALFLGQYWKENYLEWSRLLIDSSPKIPGISKALTIYAGLDVLLTTQYSCYFGYTRPHVRRIFSRFKLEKETLAFSIPERGEHEYLMLKGCFIRDFQHYYEKSVPIIKNNSHQLCNQALKEFI